jgi:nicotinamide riboside transporter PnuC
MKLKTTINRGFRHLRHLMMTRGGLAALLIGLGTLIAAVCIVNAIETGNPSFYFYGVAFAALFACITLQLLRGGDDL